MYRKKKTVLMIQRSAVLGISWGSWKVCLWTKGNYSIVFGKGQKKNPLIVLQDSEPDHHPPKRESLGRLG